MLKAQAICSSLLLVIFSSIAAAQTGTAKIDKSSGTTITASALGERVRFTAHSSVVQIRLEVYNWTGRKLFDNEVRGGNVLDWHLQDGQAEPLADDSYLCVVTVKSLSGKLTQSICSVTVEKLSASLQRLDTSQITAQQAQAVGPIEENASLTVLTQDENRTTTVIAHNGEEGLITRGRGALSFRIGDFFSGKDIEQMRLSPEGNLGIGITHPQVRLDVDGLIRASQGIMFPDGTIQTTAAFAADSAKGTTGQPTTGQSPKPIKLGKASGGNRKGQNTVSPETLINDDLTVNGSIFFTTGFPRDLAMLNNTGGVRIYSAPTLTNSPASAAIQFFGTGSAFTGQAYIDSGAHDNAAVIFRTAGTGGTIAERMRITSGGDVLIANKWRTEATTVNPGPVAGPPNLIGGFLGTGSGGATPGNRVTTGVVGATIGGGGFNGTLNFPSVGSLMGDGSNRVTDWFGTVGGGWSNRAGNDNATLDNAFFATVGGGGRNTASGESATVGGGDENTASLDGSTVSGGELNTASGQFSTVPGGRSNTAMGDYSLAAGRRAKANHQGAFVWADSTNADFASTANDQFLIRAAGGVGIGTTAPSKHLHVFGAGDQEIAIQSSDSGGRQWTLQSSQGSSNGRFEIIDRTAPASRFSILDSGNVGIGTSAPTTFKLQVAGAVGPDADNSFGLGDAMNRWTAVFAVNGMIQTSDARQSPLWSARSAAVAAGQLPVER